LNSIIEQYIIAKLGTFFYEPPGMSVISQKVEAISVVGCCDMLN